MRLVILLAVVLAVSAVECVASCAGDDCAPKTPPCHHSQQVKCTREIPVGKAPTVAPTVALPPAGFSVTFAGENQPLAVIISNDPVPSPPPLILRI